MKITYNGEQITHDRLEELPGDALLEIAHDLLDAVDIAELNRLAGWRVDPDAGVWDSHPSPNGHGHLIPYSAFGLDRDALLWSSQPIQVRHLELQKDGVWQCDLYVPDGFLVDELRYICDLDLNDQWLEIRP